MGWFRDWQVPDRGSGNRTFALWRRLAGSGLYRHGTKRKILTTLDAGLGECGIPRDVFPIQVALGRIAARRNAVAKRIMKSSAD